MPILTFVSFAGHSLASNGETVQIPPSGALQQRGPVVQLAITVEQSIALELAKQGDPVPAPVSGFGLIDTGASVTCIDDELARKLGLPVVDQMRMSSASHSDTMQNVYPIQMVISGLNFTLNVPRAMGASLAAQGIIALIGRDALQICTLFYNGLSGQVAISI